MTASEFVQTAIEDASKVTIFSKSWCPYCKRAKALFQSAYPETSITIKDIDELAEESAIQDYLFEKTGKRSVPSIWIDEKYIGGCDDVVAFEKDGKLAGLLGTAPSKL